MHSIQPVAGPSSAPTSIPEPSRRFFIPTSSFASPSIPSSHSSFSFDDALHLHAGTSSLSASTGHEFPTALRYRARGRGQSLAALTSALQTYRVPPDPSPMDSKDEGEIRGMNIGGHDTAETFSQPNPTDLSAVSTLPASPRTPPQINHGQTGNLTLDRAFTPNGSRSLSAESRWAMGPSDMRTGMGLGEQGVDPEIMDALVDIHRVLYRGREDQLSDNSGSWAREKRGLEGEMGEVERVVKRWFEGDCVYDHPLLRLASRPSLMTHFILLHLLASGSIPALTPSNALLHARLISRRLSRRIKDSLSFRSFSSFSGGDVNTETSSREVKDNGKGKEKAENDLVTEEYQERLSITNAQIEEREMNQKGKVIRGDRWKLWDVGAECTEIGGMECYDGYHLGLIEHVITLTLLPIITHPPHIHLNATTQLQSSQPSFASLELAAEVEPGLRITIPSAFKEAEEAPSRSFSERLVSALGREVGFLGRWELPITTIVQFNEVGKVTHIRDTIDIQDIIEAFVPFAKRLNWLTRRVSGLLTSTLGSAVLGIIMPKSIHKALQGDQCLTAPIAASSIRAAGKARAFGSEITSSSEIKDTSPTTTDSDSSAMTRGVTVDGMTRNSLGLQGVSHVDLGPMYEVKVLGRTGSESRTGAGMAPDRDEPAM